MASVLSPNIWRINTVVASNKKDKQICKTLAFVEISTKKVNKQQKVFHIHCSTSSVSVEYQMEVVIRHYSRKEILVANLRIKSRISINFYSQLALNQISLLRWQHITRVWFVHHKVKVFQSELLFAFETLAVILSRPKPF